jgi:hypothetical protein
MAIGSVACGSGAVSGQALRSNATPPLQASGADKMSRSPAQQKLDSHIYFAELAARGAVSSAMDSSLPNMVKLLELDGQGHVHVDIEGTVNPGLLTEIVALGGTVESSFADYGTIRAWIPLLSADTLAARSDVTFIKPAAKGTTNSPAPRQR